MSQVIPSLNIHTLNSVKMFRHISNISTKLLFAVVQGQE